METIEGTQSSRLKIAKQIADDFDLVKRCTKLEHSKVGHRKSSEPSTEEELEASLERYLKHFSTILKTLGSD